MDNVTFAYNMLDKIEHDFHQLEAHLQAAKRRLDNIGKPTTPDFYAVHLYEEHDCPWEIYEEYFSNIDAAMDFIDYMMKVEYEIEPEAWEIEIDEHDKNSRTYTFKKYTIALKHIQPRHVFNG